MDETQAKHVTMVDLDEIVMEACALHMKSVCGNYLDKSQRKGDRYHVITGDALYFMEEHSTMVPVCNINLHVIYALSFYRSQNVLGWSKFFVPEQKFVYILWQSQTFCAKKDDLHSVKLVFVPAQIFLKRH